VYDFTTHLSLEDQKEKATQGLQSGRLQQLWLIGTVCDAKYPSSHEQSLSVVTNHHDDCAFLHTLTAWGVIILNSALDDNV
jgi:hypothetical protein